MDKTNKKIRIILDRYFVGNKPDLLMFQFTGIVKYVPLIVCGGFFFLTILIFAFGPLDWKIDNSLTLYSFLISCLIALILGYILAIKKGKVSDSKLNLNSNNILIMCAVVYFIIYIPTVFTRTGKLYPDFITGLFHAGEAYQNSKYYSAHGSQFFEYVRMLLSPFLVMVMPITLFFMPKLSKMGKLLGMLAIICTVILGISQGINKMCADFTAQIVLFLILLFFSNLKKGSAMYRVKIFGVIILVCSLFFLYYSVSMRSRIAMDNSLNQLGGTSSVSQENTNSLSSKVTSSASQENTNSLSSKVTSSTSHEKDNSSSLNSTSSTSQEEIDYSVTKNAMFSVATEKSNDFFYNIIPEKVKPTALFLSSYLTHGYKGLSIAMDQEFTCSYGMGFSEFFRHNVLKVIGKPDMEKQIYNNTYAGKTIKGGWETGAVWSTFFVYPASDITFVGTIFLVFIIGYIFALAWKDALKTENIFSIVVFFNICIMIFYFPANNQLFQGGESFIGFTSALIIWLITRYMTLRNSRS